MDNDVYVYNSYGKKYEVFRRCLELFVEFLIGDYIVFYWYCGFYWYYVIIEEIYLEIGIFDIIEYFNIVEGFWNDNSDLEDLLNFFLLFIVRVMRRSWRLNF